MSRMPASAGNEDFGPGTKFMLSLVGLGALAMVFKKGKKEDPRNKALRDALTAVKRALRAKDIAGAMAKLVEARDASSHLKVGEWGHADLFAALRTAVADVNRAKVGPVSGRSKNPRVVLSRDLQNRGLHFWRNLRRNPNSATEAELAAFLRKVDPGNTRTRLQWDRYFATQRHHKQVNTESSGRSKERDAIRKRLFSEYIGKIRDPQFPRITPYQRKKLMQLDNSRKLKMLERVFPKK